MVLHKPEVAIRSLCYFARAVKPWEKKSRDDTGGCNKADVERLRKPESAIWPRCNTGQRFQGCKLADDAPGGDAPDMIGHAFGEPEVAVRPGRNPEREALRRGDGKAGESDTQRGIGVTRCHGGRIELERITPTSSEKQETDDERELTLACEHEMPPFLHAMRERMLHSASHRACFQSRRQQGAHRAVPVWACLCQLQGPEARSRHSPGLATLAKGPTLTATKSVTREKLEVDIELTIGDRDRGCLLEPGGCSQFWTRKTSFEAMQPPPMTAEATGVSLAIVTEHVTWESDEPAGNVATTETRSQDVWSLKPISSWSLGIEF